VEEGIRLGLWVANRRADYRKGRLPRRHVLQLDNDPGWTWHVRQDLFEDCFEHLLRFVEREGHARVPVDHVERGFRLGAWVHKRRTRDGMSAARIHRLEALPGWVWNVFEAQWEEGLAHLKAYIEREGHALVPAQHVERGFHLGRWVSHLRQRRPTIPPERARELDTIPSWRWRVRPPRRRR
jgi:hypothetical protein